MAFDVSPTSGAVPFVFTAEFFSRYALDTNLYDLEAYIQTAVGSCPASGTTGTLSSVIPQSLLESGAYTLTNQGNIVAGSCRTVTLVIREVASGTIISQDYVNIDNIEWEGSNFVEVE